MHPLIVIRMIVLPAFAQAGERERTALIWKVLGEHRLLSEKQLSCSYLIERDGSTNRIVKVGVYETHDARCGGDPDVSHRLFDLELDRRSQKLRWDNNPDQEMRRVLRRRHR